MPTMVLVASASLTAIPPFFEPGAPPPTLPILIAQTEVGSVDTPSKLLAQEEIGSGPTVAWSARSARSSVRFTPYPKLASKQPLSAMSNHHNNDSTYSDRDTTDLESSIADTDSEFDDSHLIPKPEGEAGRPGCGGYNLEQALKWERKKYLQIKVSNLGKPMKTFTDTKSEICYETCRRIS